MFRQQAITAILFLAAAPVVWGQLGTATISGTVRDHTGAVVPGSAVKVTNQATGFERSTISNNTGEFNLPGLAPGVYDLSVQAQGFKTYQSRGLILQVDQNAHFDVPLQVGQVSETVEVTGQAPLVESQSASMGAVVDQQKILALPLNGRNFVELALLVPGANTGAPGQGGGGGFSVSGLRSEQNAFQIDGTSNSDGFQNDISVRPSIDALQEFKIQTNNYSAEFGKGAGAQVNIVTRSGTQALHGTLYYFIRNNQIQARRFFDTNRISFPCDRSEANAATRPACAPPFNQNQFGVTLGGPVVLPVAREKKTFFFVNYEGFRQVRGAAGLHEVATQAQRDGDFTANLLAAAAGTDALGRQWRRGQIFDPRSSREVIVAGRARFVREAFPNNVIPRSRFDAVAARILQDTEFFPVPNAPGVAAANGNVLDNFVDGRSNRNSTNQGSFRVDHQFSAADTVYARLTVNDSAGYNPRSFPGFGSFNDQRNLNGTVSYTRVISPSTLNELRLGYQGWFQNNDSERKVNWIEKFGITGLDHARNDPAIQGAPAFTITGYTGFGDDGGLPLIRRNNTYQLIDNFSFNKGRHFIKVGGEIRRVFENVVRAQVTRGDFQFSNAQWTGIDGVANTGHTFANFVLGLTRQKSRRISDFATRLRPAEYGFYVQDDFKATQRLTLNIGLRYMLYIPPYDTRDRISTFIHPQRCPSFDVCGGNFGVTNNPYIPFWGLAKGTAQEYNAVALPRGLSTADRKNFGPRFGFAWQPFGSGKTVVRGGYGMFFDTVPILLTEDTIENWPYVIEDQQDIGLFQNGPPPPEGFLGFFVANPGLQGPVAPFFPGPNVYAPDFKNAYIQSWNFGIQRELPGQMVVEVAHVGTKGTRLNRRENTNTAEPLGIRARWGNLTNDTRIPDHIGAGRNQFRRLVPFAVQNGVIVPLSNVFETTASAFSNYNGMQARIEKRFSQGLTYLTTYTWSKAISDASGFTGGGSAGTGNRIQDIFNKRADKGLADVDHRHRFTTAFVYDLPFGKGKRFGGGASAGLNRLIGGWAVDGILSLQTGYPITVRRSGDPGSVGTDGALRPDLVCNPNIARGNQKVELFFRTECYPQPESLVSGDVRYGTAGRSTATGPGIIGLDTSLRKVTAITERVTTEFRAEFFNTPNHANWGVPTRDLGNANFGRITGTADPRILQFGLKVMF